jgi:sugar/nucleoside kinase (ribokinase family)
MDSELREMLPFHVKSNASDKTTYDIQSNFNNVVVIGHVTRDILRNEARLGGSVVYAAQAAQLLGYRVSIVTACRENEPILGYLDIEGFQYHSIESVICKSDKTTVFRIDYSGAQRHLKVEACADPIQIKIIPDYIFSASFVYIAPIIDEISSSIIEYFKEACVVIGIQGWMRKVTQSGDIIFCDFDKKIPRKVEVIVYSELDHPRPNELAERLFNNAEIIVITRGVRGVTVYENGHRIDIRAKPTTEVDPTGAGDVFGIVMGLGVKAGLESVEAACQAMEAAARVVEGAGVGRLKEWSSLRYYDGIKNMYPRSLK